MSLPKVLEFEMHGQSPGRAFGGRLCFYARLGTRAPRKGEWYVSGAIPQAWRAPNDLTTEYLIVRPTHYARRVTAYERGKAVKV